MEQEHQEPTLIVLPLFVFEGGDLTIAASVEAAELEIEGIDAAEYVGFDAQGTVLRIEGVGVEDSRRWVQVGSTTISGGGKTDRPDLERRLRQYIESVGPDRLGTSASRLSGMTLDELVELVAQRGKEGQGLDGSGYVVLLGFNRWSTVLGLAAGTLAGVVGLLIGLNWLGGPDGGSARARGIVLLAASLVAAVGCVVLLASNVFQRFAIVKANRSEIVLVYPLGLQRFIKSARMNVPAGAGDCVLVEGARSGHLTEFQIRCGAKVLTTHLGTSVFESGYAEAFARRARTLFGQPRTEGLAPARGQAVHVPGGSSGVAVQRTCSWASSAEDVAERRAEASRLVGAELAAVRYYDIDYFGHDVAPDHTGSREILDDSEWQQPTWAYPDCDSVDFGVEFVTAAGEMYSVTWDPPGDREGIGIQQTPLLGSALVPDGQFAVWNVGDRSRWSDLMGKRITGVDLHYLPWSHEVEGSPKDGFWCTRITITFGDVRAVLMLGEGTEGGGVAPSADTVAVLFEPIVLPAWEDR